MQKLSIFTKLVNLNKILFTNVRTTMTSQPADYIRTNLHNGVGRYVCQMQRVTFKFCKEHPGSRGLSWFGNSLDPLIFSTKASDLCESDNDQIDRKLRNYDIPVLHKLQKFETNYIDKLRKAQQLDLNEILQTKESETVHIYTDGAARDNGQPYAIAGYGIYMKVKYEEIRLSEPIHAVTLPSAYRPTQLTISFAEVLAALRALEYLYDKYVFFDPNVAKYVILHSDSSYLIKSLNTWCINWIKADWKRTAKNEIKHKALFQAIMEVYIKLRNQHVIFVHVKGHSNDTFNDIADELAKKTITSKKIKIKTSNLPKASKTKSTSS